MMRSPITILYVDDSKLDRELVRHGLESEKADIRLVEAASREEFEDRWAEGGYDLVLTDVNIPGFGGLEVIDQVRAAQPEVPVIVITGTGSEEVAVEAMKRGADDYVVKTPKHAMGLSHVIQAVLQKRSLLWERNRAEEALRESEAKYRGLIEQAADGVFVTDKNGNFILVNSQFCSMLGYSEDELLQLNSVVTSREEERERVVERRAEVARAKRLLFERMIRRKDGSLFPVEVNLKQLDDGTRQGIVRDITERRAQQEKIARLTRIHAVLSGINSTIVRVRERDELFREACRIAVEAGKFPLAWIGVVDRHALEIRPVAWDGMEQDFLGLVQGRLLLSENAPRGRGPAAMAVIEKKAVIVNDVPNDQRLGFKKELLERGICSIVMLPLLVSGEAPAVLALHAAEAGFFDDEEMKLLSDLAGDIAFALDHLEKGKRLEYLAYYDSLTGLANRTLFHERVEQHVRAAGREQRKLALLLVDLERFKSINDTLGRQAGDKLLKQIAGRMTQGVVDSGRLARVSADHFAIVIPDAGIDDVVARRLEEQFREWFSEPFRVNDIELRIAAKVGIAIYPHDGADAETLFRNAEAALKRAKTSGERYMFYAQEMNERVAEKLTLENKLRQALEREEFVLHYQPVVEARTRRIVSVEALLRWMNPELGLVPPMTFIPLIEETGLILEVGMWALHQAVRDYRHWLEQGVGAPRVAVNVSPVQLRRRDFVAVVEEALERGGAPTGIDLEITESLIMEDIEASIEKLKALRTLGVNLAVDDFGTGYSSLGYLARLPIETLKIDRSFIITMSSDPNAMTLVSTIITLAHSLKLKVTAEGVDSEEQAKFLRLLRCDQMQGYLFSRPLPRERLTDLLRQGG